MSSPSLKKRELGERKKGAKKMVWGQAGWKGK